MQLSFPERACRLTLQGYYVFIGFMILAFGLLTLHNQRSWTISDWLINYQGGFVRRGFAGEVAYLLGRLLHVSPIYLVVLLYLSLYAILLFAIYRLALLSTWSLWVLALLFSPATLAFPVLDPEAGFRKELLYLAAFSLLVFLLQRFHLRSPVVAIYLSVTVTVAVLSHESLICFVPYSYAALVLSGRRFGQAARECALPLLLGIFAAFLCAHHLGDLKAATSICSSLGYPLLSDNHNQVCSGGAIAYLGYTRAMAREETRQAVLQYHFVALYLGLGLLAFAPALWGSWSLARSGFAREIRILWTAAAISGAGSLILFLYAVDWGRWLYIHLLSIMILLLVVDARHRRDRQVSSPGAERAIGTPARKVLVALALIAYSTLWTFPHVPMHTSRAGYIGLSRYLIWFKNAHQHSR